MIEVLFYIAGAVTIVVLFTLWCIVSIERVRKEREISAYAALCGRIQEQINETRDRISSVKMHLYVTDHNLDQVILRWKYEYLIKQEQWLIELMCGKMEEKDVQQMSEVRKALKEDMDRNVGEESLEYIFPKQRKTNRLTDR